MQALEFGHFSCACSNRPKGEQRTAQGFSPGLLCFRPSGDGGMSKLQADAQRLMMSSPGTGVITRCTRTSCMNCDFDLVRGEYRMPVPGTSHESAGTCDRYLARDKRFTATGVCFSGLVAGDKQGVGG